LHFLLGPQGGVFTVGFSPVEFEMLPELLFRVGNEESGASLHPRILAATVRVRHLNLPVNNYLTSLLHYMHTLALGAASGKMDRARQGDG
jgi:hypothetical protein